MPKRITRSLLLAVLATSACNSPKDTAASAAVASRVATTPAPAVAATGSGSGASGGLAPPRVQDFRKIIRTGSIELVVGAYDAARDKLEALVSAAGGYVDSTRVVRREDQVSDATIVVRVPQSAFGDLIPKLHDLGQVVSETTNAQDITADYVDLSARLSSAQTLEKRLLALVGDRTANLDQVLTVERELERVRGEIEGYEGHLRQWNDEIAMSTLTVKITTKRPEIVAAPAPAEREPTLGERTAGAFRGSIAVLRDVGSALFVGGTALLPWLLFLVPGAVFARRLVRRYRRRLPEAVARP